MSKLFRASMRRYLKSPVLWMGLAASLIMGMAIGSFAADHGYYEPMHFVAVIFIIASVISLNIGAEFSEGGFRNKIVGGHGKGSIYLTEMLLALIISSLLFFVHTAGFIAFNMRLFDKEPYPVMPSPSMPCIFIGFFLAALGFACICILLCTCISHKAAAPIACLLVSFALIFVTYELESALGQPEFTYDMVSIRNEDGMIIGYEKSDPRPNSKYIGGSEREILDKIYNAMPFSHVVKYTDILSIYLPQPNINLDVNEETMEIFKTSPLWLSGVSAALLTAGYFLFVKKEMN